MLKGNKKKNGRLRDLSRDFKIDNPRPISCNTSLPEPQQCRQICYQLAHQMAEQDMKDRGLDWDAETLDAIACKAVELIFEEKRPSGKRSAERPVFDNHPLHGAPIGAVGAEFVLDNRSVEIRKDLLPGPKPPTRGTVGRPSSKAPWYN